MTEIEIAEVTHRTRTDTDTSSIAREDFPHILVQIQTEEDKPQTKEKQGNVKEHKASQPKASQHGQWEGIIDHTELKLASNIMCTNVPDMEKLQNCKTK